MTKVAKIMVIGSSNMDMVIQTHHIPVPGETVLGGGFFMAPGGKGANQAVAVARLGGEVCFVSKIGDDIFGKQSIQAFEEEGIDTIGLVPDDSNPSGVALITVDDHGENSIVVAPGANANLMCKDLEKVFNESVEGVQIVLIQLEIPMEAVKCAAKLAKERNIKVILNPAPANKDTSSLFGLIDILTPNASEAEILTGLEVKDLESAKIAAKAIYKKGVKNVIVTVGKLGAIIVEDNDQITHVAASEVDAVDTTGAGDAFNGALAVALSEGKSLKESVKFACRAAAITVTRMGAQSSMPFRKELVLNFLE